jgi:hypothetical protein
MANLARVAEINRQIATYGQAAPSASQTSGGGAVSAQGQIIGAGGRVLGMANPADVYSGGATQAQPTPAQPTATQQVAAPTQPIQTPIPTTAPGVAQVTPPNTQMDMATAIASKGSPLTSAEMADPQAMQDLASQYRAGLAKVQGTQAPTTPGMAGAAIQGALPGQQQEAPSIIGGLMETDSAFDSILTLYDQFMSPAQQKTSLLEEYNQLSSSLGIQAMNAELIDAKRIIEGTTDDIRLEITATGGIATDSQVLALANARNKSLIKNYNYLLESRNSAMTQLNTMMQLSIQDRQMAEAEFDRKLNFAFKVQEFKQRATDNARQTYVSLGNSMGWDSLLSSVSPYEQGVIQRTLGLSSDALTNLASRSMQDRQLALQEQQLGLDIKRAQLSGLSLDNQKKIQGLLEEPKGVDDLYQQERSTRVLQSVGELKGRVGKSTVGFFGSNLARVPGTSARDFRADLETLKANIFSGELTAMRAASKTGGAVGNVSDKEGEKLQSALGALDQGQSVASFNRNLQQIEDSIVRWYEAIHGAGLSVAPDGSGNLIRIID